MSSKQWTDVQTKDIMKKVIRRAEVSRIARLLQHRLALANIKTQNGWENLTLDAIEPKIEEDLKRKRQKCSQENTPLASPQKSFFSDRDLEWLRRNRVGNHQRTPSQGSSIGPLPTFRNSRKRARNATDFNTPASTKRQRIRKGGHGRMIQSSPGYYDSANSSPRSPKFQPTFHSSPPRTPPRRIIAVSGRPGATGEEGAGLLMYLANTPSPAMPKTRFVPTTPPSRAAALPSSMNTPGCPQTPQTGFNFSDFVNITPSPAQGAFGPVVRGTPIANARKRLNFDQLVPPSGSPPNRAPVLGMELGDLVS